VEVSAQKEVLCDQVGQGRRASISVVSLRNIEQKFRKDTQALFHL